MTEIIEKVARAMFVEPISADRYADVKAGMDVYESELKAERDRYKAALDDLRNLFGLTLYLIRNQGWGDTTEYNFELFEEDIFPALGIKSFPEIDKYKDAALNPKLEVK